MYNNRIQIPMQLWRRKREWNNIGGLPYHFDKRGDSRQNKCVAKMLRVSFWYPIIFPVAKLENKQ
jgi:hypothetical protein